MLETLNKALQSLVSRGRAAFEIIFPGQDYQSDVWDIRHLAQKGMGRRGTGINFTSNIGARSVPKMSNEYLAVVKALVAIREKSPGAMAATATSFKWLWISIMERRGGNPDHFTWASLKEADLEKAESIMREQVAESTTNLYMAIIMSTLDDLVDIGCVRRLVPILVSQKKASTTNLFVDDTRREGQKMPSNEAIHALARLFNGEFELSPLERLLICICAIMFATALRINEVLSLQVDALKQVGDRWRLSFFKSLKGEKSQDQIHEEHLILTNRQGALVSKAIVEAIEITSEARERAEVLARSPEKVPLPEGFEYKEWYTRDEVSDLLGCGPLSVYPYTTRPSIKIIAGSPNSQVKIGLDSLLGYFQEIRKKKFYESIRGVTRKSNGLWTQLQDSIFLVFCNETHRTRATIKLLVGQLFHQKVDHFLGGHEGVPSIFEKHNLREKDGSIIKMNTHEIRHYVTSKARASGISEQYLAAWQAKKSVASLSPYMHLTEKEKINLIKREIKDGHLQGEIVDMYINMVEEDREEFLQSVVPSVHVTHLGMCVHDFNIKPCPQHLQCVKGCGSYLFDPANAQQRTRVKDLLNQTQNVRRRMDGPEDATGMYLAEWRRDADEVIEGCKKILGAEATCRPVRPFEGLPSKFERAD